MNSKYVVTLMQIASAIIVYIGFLLVTQSGQDMAMPQNDGYAGTGGMLILLGGIIFGTTVSYGYQPRKKKK